MSIKKRLSEIIIEVINDKKLSNAKIAKKLEVPTNMVDQHRRMARKPDSLFIGKFCEEYNVNPTWIISGEGERYLKKVVLDTAISPELAALETDVMTQVIQGVEEFLRDEEKELEPDIKARLISLLYEHFLKAKEKPNQKTIGNYLKLVA